MKDIFASANQEWLNEPRIVLGIMTGTSVDSVDLAVARFRRNKSGKISMRVLASGEYPVDEELRQDISRVVSLDAGADYISGLNSRLANLYRDAIENFLDKRKNIDIDAIGIHGQTVWHDPDACYYPFPSTLQIASASMLSAYLQKPVVSDFRSADIALGGQGAPLVPIFDYEYFSEKYADVCMLNIGGIANITWLQDGGDIDDIIAFDTGPGNTLIDYFMNLYYGKKFDRNGKIALSGKIIPELLEKLLKLEYFARPYPKSTGREYFNPKLIFDIWPRWKSERPEDMINTLTMLTAESIALGIKKLPAEPNFIYASGGGAKNKFIMEHLDIEIFHAGLESTRKKSISADAKEALCFAYLAYRTLGGLPGNVPAVTGAYSEVVLGSISYNNIYKPRA